jgi:hypothetical protein
MRIILLIGVKDIDHNENLQVINADGFPLQPKVMTIKILR